MGCPCLKTLPEAEIYDGFIQLVEVASDNSRYIRSRLKYHSICFKGSLPQVGVVTALILQHDDYYSIKFYDHVPRLRATYRVRRIISHSTNIDFASS